MRILLVEDDVMIAEAVRDTLKDAAYAVDWVSNGTAALSGALCHGYDVVLLDLGLPGQDGFSVLAGIRRKGLDGGADDYILKPFDMSELMARIRAVLRRKGGSSEPVLTNGVITLDPATHEAGLAGTAATFQLSNREFALLEALMLRPGNILSRSDLEERIYGWGEEVESNAVEFLIHALRKKLGSDAIRNVRGVGWLVSKNG
ncbi:DNA-binding response regulator [Rahnella sp. AA]|uniref:response regulator transcription factor n=1 Tax=Rahnella sp. AA TaxID=2057180 RepID=UPI000C3322B5|nr:response regulator transcription factor [Rahnella sp. AA]PKE32785.1 DNA-binding response regulator [Rahnella sp. AA]